MYGKKILILISVSLLITSCMGINSPNVKQWEGGNADYSYKNNNTDLWIGNKNSNSKNTDNLTEDLNWRKEVFDKIKTKKEELRKEEQALTKNLDTFVKKIKNISDLVIADLKIIKSVKDKLLEEKEINKDNHIYLLIKKDIEVRNKLLPDLEDYIKYFWKTKEVLEDYSTNMMQEKDYIDADNKLIFNIINLYIKNWKYNKEIISLIKEIEKNLDNLWVENYEYKVWWTIWKNFTIDFKKSDLEILKNLIK